MMTLATNTPPKHPITTGCMESNPSEETFLTHDDEKRRKKDSTTTQNHRKKPSRNGCRGRVRGGARVRVGEGRR